MGSSQPGDWFESAFITLQRLLLLLLFLVVELLLLLFKSLISMSQLKLLASIIPEEKHIHT
jgi:hypothetical protein